MARSAFWQNIWVFWPPVHTQQRLRKKQLLKCYPEQRLCIYADSISILRRYISCSDVVLIVIFDWWDFALCCVTATRPGSLCVRACVCVGTQGYFLAARPRFLTFLLISVNCSHTGRGKQTHYTCLKCSTLVSGVSCVEHAVVRCTCADGDVSSNMNEGGKKYPF